MDFVLDAKDFSEKLNYKQKQSNLINNTQIKEFSTELNLEFGKILFHEINLESCTVLISTYNLKHPLILKNTTSKSFLEMHFNLGGCITIGENSNPKNKLTFNNMTHNLLGVGENVSGFVDYNKGSFFKSFDVHLNKLFIDKWYGYNKLLDTFIDSYKTENATVLQPNNMAVTPQMQDIISSVINCNFKGFTRKVYLESKVQELFCLQIEQSNLSFDFSKNKTVKLTTSDISKINYAKSYVEDNIQQQISIPELAKICFINQQKLKYGFKELYGITVFKYAKKYRMQYAKKCLENGETKEEVCAKIGYANLSSFSVAFKSHFGFSPSKIIPSTT